MRGLFFIVLAKLRSHKFQNGMLFGSYVCLSFFGLGVLLLHFALKPSFDAAYRKLDGPSLCVGIGETDLDAAALETFLQGLSYVERYELGKRYLASHVELPEQSIEYAYLAASDSCSPALGQARINLAVPNTKVGDRVRLHMNGKMAEFRVEAVFLDPVNTAPENNIPYFYVSWEELENLAEGSGKGSIFAKVWSAMEEGQERKFSSDFEAYFGMPFSGELHTMDDIRHSFLFRYELFKEIAIFFFLFLFTVILVLTVFLMQMEAQGDVDMIHTLQSIGFTKGKICLIYVLRSLILAVLGGTVGMAVSAMAMKGWLGGMFAAVGAGEFSFLHLFYYLVFMMAILGITVAVTAGILEKHRSARLRNSLLLFWKPQFLCFALGLQKCMRRKAETILLLFLTMELGALGLTSFYLLDGVRQAKLHPADWGMVDMDIYVARKSNADERESGLLLKLDAEAAVDYYYAALSAHVVCQFGEQGAKKRIFAEIYDQAIPSELSFSFLSGRNPENETEVALGMNFAEENQIQIGDELILLHGEEERALSVVGIYPSYKAYANSIRIITPDIQGFFRHQAEGYYSLVLCEGEDVSQYAKELAKSFEDFDFFPMQGNAGSFARQLFYPLAASLSLLLLLYFFLLVLLKQWISLECKEEWECLHHIGMTKGKIGEIIRWRFMLPIAIGAILAIPLSLYAFPLWLRPLAKRLGLLQLPIYPTAPMVAVALFALLLLGRLAACNAWRENAND